MIKFETEIIINATREKVWEAIVDAKSFEEWTRHFSKGSFYRGAWTEGSEIRFLARDSDGKESGMFSTIVINEFPEHILIKHLGIISNNQVDTESEIAREWTPAYEEYFIEKIDPNQTRLRIVADVPDSLQKEIFDSWNLALPALKAISERD